MLVDTCAKGPHAALRKMALPVGFESRLSSLIIRGVIIELFGADRTLSNDQCRVCLVFTATEDSINQLEIWSLI